MSTYEQLPGTLGLSFRRGDSVSTEIDFSPISLTGYTMTASVLSLVSGAQVVAMSTAFTSAVDGKVNISLTDEQTAALPVGTYQWEMTGDASGTRRTYLTGFVEVSP